MTPRAVRVEDELWDAAIAKASANKDNLSAIIRDALRRYLEESEHMSISDEAVEAGYAVLSYLAIGRDEVRAVLEAASPHMLMRGDDRYWTQYRRHELGEWQQQTATDAGERE